MLDTRTKIVNAADAPRGRRAAIAYFDPMLPAYVEELHQAVGEGAVIVIADPPGQYLAKRARAELAASLSFVDAVVLAESEPQTVVEMLHPEKQIILEERELQLRAEFLHYVRDRAKRP